MRRFNKLVKLLLLSFSVMVVSVSQAESQSSKLLHSLFDKEWQANMDRFPEFAEAMGDDSKADQLSDVSEAAQQKWLKVTEGFMLELGDIELKSLSTADKVNFQIFEQRLLNRISQLRFKDYQIPFLADSGFHTSIARLPAETEFKTKQNFQRYLSRLEKIPHFFIQNKTNMNAGLARNFSMPAVVMNGFTDVLKKHANSSVENSVFFAPFKHMPKAISAKDQQDLVELARLVISTQVIPAYQDLANYFDNDYIPRTKKSLGAIDFPSGGAYYQHKINQYTTGNLSPRAIHNLGLKEVKRIRSEMEAIIESLNFEGDFKQFLRFLRESPQFYAKTPEQLLKEAAYIAKKMDGQLPRFFTKLPRQPYTVEAVPESIAPKYTTGRYVSAPLDSTRPGTYWVNTYALDKRPLYVLESLTLHEAVPGHHLQGALNQELENLPNFRRYSYISAFGEGWALYCEKLGLEAGFYKDPYSDFGRLSYEMWRAARLVIDTGIHSFGWTREQSIELLEENSALSKHNIRTEVDRYISWPGQALSYKLGELKIIELRQMAEEQLGDKFDIRLFHDAILENGSIPLDILEKQIDIFVQQQMEGKEKE